MCLRCAPTALADDRTMSQSFAPALSLAVSVHALPDESRQVHFHAGGQGFWVARMVARLGTPVTLCAPVGGEPGQVQRGLVEGEGVSLESVETEAGSSVWLSDGRSGDDASIIETAPAPLSVTNSMICTARP